MKIQTVGLISLAAEDEPSFRVDHHATKRPSFSNKIFLLLIPFGLHYKREENYPLSADRGTSVNKMQILNGFELHITYCKQKC